MAERANSETLRAPDLEQAPCRRRYSSRESRKLTILVFFIGLVEVLTAHIWAVTGSNSVGKQTLLAVNCRTIAGTFQPSHGEQEISDWPDVGGIEFGDDGALEQGNR